MFLSNKELHTLNEIEHNLRADDPRLDRSLRTMMSPEDTTSMYLTLSILGVFVLGIALRVGRLALHRPDRHDRRDPGRFVGRPGGTTTPRATTSSRWSRPDRCPRCTAESSGTSGR